MNSKDRLRILPKVDLLLEDPSVLQFLKGLQRPLVLRAVQCAVDKLRENLLTGTVPSGAGVESDLPLDRSAAARWVVKTVDADLQALRTPSLRRVINATGVILHTNLGRAVLAPEAIQAVNDVARGYVNLEYDLVRGERGSRMDHVDELIRRVVGADAGFVVNNNAAAVLLAVDTLGQVGVIVSRGEQVEIGDSFRLPDILARSGVPIHEVGTTNRTSAEDYVRAAKLPGCIFLKVHRSNFVQHGFTHEASVAELAAAAATCGAKVVYDLGSGSLKSFSSIGLAGEPDVESALRAGADLITMSGDKLLGGPQAGIIAGRVSEVNALRRNPLARALRIDKLTLAALQSTLLSYAKDGAANVPTLRLIACPPEEIEARAQRILDSLQGIENVDLQCAKGSASVGGGAFADTELESFEVRVRPHRIRASGLLKNLRMGSPAVVARIKDDWIALDARCIGDDEVELLAGVLSAALARRGRVE